MAEITRLLTEEDVWKCTEQAVQEVYGELLHELVSCDEIEVLNKRNEVRVLDRIKGRLYAKLGPGNFELRRMANE